MESAPELEIVQQNTMIGNKRNYAAISVTEKSALTPEIEASYETVARRTRNQKQDALDGANFKPSDYIS